MQRYIEKLNPAFFGTLFPAEFRADMVVVIPCYDEPDLPVTLKNLLNCRPADGNVLVAAIFNSGERSAQAGVLQNRLSFAETVAFARGHDSEKLRFFPLIFENLPRKHAGVGLARKIGMDLAVRHFAETENRCGVIVSLDADCTVSENFLTEIYDAFRRNEKLNATIHNFCHRAENNDAAIETAVRQYEAYIRYFCNRLQWAEFPYYHHTIGSAFAVSADAYVRAGGMGRQQGGEDFYFLQKVFALGGVKELWDVFVYPLARFSDRVPFGTGPALQKIMAEPHGRMRVYAPEAFAALKQFFAMKDAFYKADAAFVKTEIGKLHPSLVEFILQNNVLADIDDCNRNSASAAAFRKRFFHHFNAFRVIKYLNFAHQGYFELVEVSGVNPLVSKV